MQRSRSNINLTKHRTQAPTGAKSHTPQYQHAAEPLVLTQGVVASSSRLKLSTVRCASYAKLWRSSQHSFAPTHTEYHRAGVSTPCRTCVQHHPNRLPGTHRVGPSARRVASQLHVAHHTPNSGVRVNIHSRPRTRNTIAHAYRHHAVPADTTTRESACLNRGARVPESFPAAESISFAFP